MHKLQCISDYKRICMAASKSIFFRRVWCLCLMELTSTSLLRRFSLSPWWANNMFDQFKTIYFWKWLLNPMETLFTEEFNILGRWDIPSRDWSPPMKTRSGWKYTPFSILKCKLSIQLVQFKLFVFFLNWNCHIWHINRQTNVRKGVLFKFCSFP